MKKILLLKKLVSLLLVHLALITTTHAQTTYNVTSTSIDGPGSFLEAVNSANSNPGADIIEFTAGLQVDAATPASSTYQYLIQLTESVIIDGNGGALNGVQTWVDANGNINPTTSCPGSTSSDLILAVMPGFMKVGVNSQDNSSINVTVKNLTIKQFNQVADIRDNASLTFENFEAQDTWSTFGCLGYSMIEGGNGTNLTITDSRFFESETWQPVGVSPAIIAINAGDLTIEGTVFDGLNKNDQYAVLWEGVTGTEVNIVSSRFRDSGGIYIQGESQSNIVNTIIVTDYLSKPGFGDRIINDSNGDMNIIASSLKWNNNECDAVCQAANNQYLIERKGAGAINFFQSAVGFTFVVEPPTNALMTLGETGTNGITADEYTWIQPTLDQDAVALKAITNQPVLLTDLPAFNDFAFPDINGDFDLVMVTPAFPGELIDVIPSTEVLINPIDGSPITTDVIGNDRFDANGFRDIGALQLSLAPILTIAGSANEFVELSWQEPLHHDGEPIVRYEYQYVETGGGSPTVVDAGMSLSANVTGLTNGTEYEFSVRAVYNEGGSEVNGPYSNTVTETPLGPFGTPIVTANPGDTEVSLSWTVSGLGGRDFDSYSILWRIDGTSDYIGALATFSPGETSITVPGLTNDITYEFAVAVNASGEVSDQGFATATPSATLGIEEISKKEISIYPIPFEDTLNFRIQDENFNIKLFNILGKLLIETENNNKINVSNLSAGIYIINIQTNNKMYTTKVVKQ